MSNKSCEDERRRRLLRQKVGIEDPYLNMELGIRHKNEEGLHHERFKRRALDNYRKPMRTPSNNPLLDRWQYDVKFIDRTINILIANIIAKKSWHKLMTIDTVTYLLMK